jgi:hypothetical protein
MLINLSTFCPCPKTLWKAKFKGNRLVNFAEEISRQSNIQDAGWILLDAFARFIVRIGSKKQSRKKLKHDVLPEKK